MPDERRLAVVIKGGVSLGAYEAGVITELLKIIEYNNLNGSTPWFVDTIAGASAGSITGAILARVLLDTRPFGNPAMAAEHILRQIWVEDISMDLMTQNAASSNTVLDSNSVWNLATRYFPTPPADASSAHSALRKGAARIGLVFTLSGLGLDPNTTMALNRTLAWHEYAKTARFEIEVGASNSSSVAFSSSDTAAWRHNPSDPPRITGQEAFAAMLHAAVTSGAFPLAFAPRGLALYEDDHLWHSNYFVDGGVYDNDPVGQMINVAHDVDWSPSGISYQDRDRRFLIVHTDPMPVAEYWPPPGVARTEVLSDLSPLSFLGEFIPGFIEESQSSGLRGIGEVNRKIEEREKILSDICSLLNTTASSFDFFALRHSLEFVVSALARRRNVDPARLSLLRQWFIEDLRGLEDDLYNRALQLKDRPNVQEAFRELGLLVDFAADLADKVRFKPIVVAPALPLAGNPLYGFSGFFLKEIREHDFEAGRADVYQAFANIDDHDFRLYADGSPQQPAPFTLSGDLKRKYDESQAQFRNRVDIVVNKLLSDYAAGIPVLNLPLVGDAITFGAQRIVDFILNRFLGL